MKKRCRLCKKYGDCAKQRRICKICERKRIARWAKNNPEKRQATTQKWRKNNPLRVLEYRLRSEYRFSELIIRKILSWRGSKCFCGKILKKFGTGWHDARIEHNHKTGKFRGITCGRCNYVLGAVEDNRRLLSKMRKYLKRGQR